MLRNYIEEKHLPTGMCVDLFRVLVHGSPDSCCSQKPSSTDEGSVKNYGINMGFMFVLFASFVSVLVDMFGWFLLCVWFRLSRP